MHQKNAIRALLAVCILVFGFHTKVFASEGGEEGKKSKGDEPLYVDFKNIVVPVIKRNGETGVIALSLMAQVKDQEDQSKVMGQLPRLRDAFIRVLYGNLEGTQMVKEDGALDIPQIRERLLKTANLVLHEEKDNELIKDLLFQNIAQQSY